MDSRLRRWCNLTWADTHKDSEHTSRLYNCERALYKDKENNVQVWEYEQPLMLLLWLLHSYSEPSHFLPQLLKFHDAVIVLLLQKAWKSQLKPNMGCGWRTCVLGRRCAPTLPSTGETGRFTSLTPRIRAGLETMCIEHLKDDYFVLNPHPMEEITRHLLHFNDECPSEKKIRLLDYPSFAQLKYILFHFCLSILFLELHALCVAYHSLVTMLPCWIPRYPTADCWNLWGSGVYAYSEYLGPLGWITLGPLLGMSSTSGGSPGNPSLEVRVPAAPLMSQRTFTVAWMRFASDCYGWWRTAGIRCNSLVFVWRRMQNPRLLGFCFKTGADSWPGNFSFTQRGDQ